MERLMVVTTFQKTIDSLKTTECSQKEKLALFTQISDCIQSSALRANANYLNFVSNAVSILLMFCEDIDSVIRMSAEENLNRIIRFSTPLNVVRIQYDLFQEIKRNGNDRSLRIALNLFGHYAHMIKQRKVKPYALNLLPCILSISQRKEQQLIETLSSFLVKFCEYFQISLTENEVSNLIEYFLKDAIGTECSVKRRCSASNVMTLIEHSRRPDIMSKHALTLCLDNLAKDFTLNTIVGALGLLRILLPKILTAQSLENCVTHKVIEIYEICLHLLNDSNHTIINASLECLCVILNNSKPQLTTFLVNDKLMHMEILCKKRSLKNQIFRRKLSSSSFEMSTSKNLFESPKNAGKAKKSEIRIRTSSTRELDNSESDASNVLDNTSVQNALCDDRGLLTGSDIELDSMRLNDFELCQSNESLVQMPDKNSPAIKKSGTETNPLKSQKSTDSIGSFLNTLMHPNTESVSKFFRVGSSSQTSDAPAQHIVDDLEDDLNQTGTLNMSEMSDGSMLSLNSSALGTFDMLNKTDDSIPEIEILNDQEIATIRLEADQMDHEKPTDDAEQTIDNASNTLVETIKRQIPIGSIGNQPLIYYTIRLVASKFLLLGTSYDLIDDCEVRVSIKNSSLAVIGHCIALCPRTILLSLQYIGPDDVTFEHNSDSDESECSHSEKGSPSKVTKASDEPCDELNIKDDHFGENSKVPKTYFDFSFPLSKSADNVLLSRLTSGNSGGDSANRTQNLNANLSDMLSKSDIIDSKTMQFDITIESNLNSTDKSLSNPALIQSMTDCSPQFIEDILLFWNHSDPVLRANVQLIAGNFLFNVLNECSSIAHFIERLEIASTYRFLNFNVLFHILMRGLNDEIHTVVKQSLVSLEKILLVLLDHRPDWFYDENICLQPRNTNLNDTSIEYMCINSPTQLLQDILEKLTLVFDNKYWVIQNKYCHFIATINYDALHQIVGQDKAHVYKDRFISHIYAMLKDGDARIRNEAANALLIFNLSQLKHPNKGINFMAEFTAEILLNEVPFSIENSCEPLHGFQFAPNSYDRRKVKRVLGKYLFDLSNMLFNLKSTEQLFGATKCLLNTISAFNPIQFVDIWSEYNILDVCIELLVSNYSTGTDLSNQCDLLTISTNLLTAMALRKSPDPENHRKAVTSTLVGHVMKLLSIYHNVLINKRPVFIPKGQKPDLFVNSRELQLINSYGYFGNDYFYLKIYKILRIIHENYKITINEEIDSKLFSLLRTCLKTMSLLLEIMDPYSGTESTVFFDEILIYVKTFLIYEPKMSVVCIKQLIRNMFSMTYPNWKIDENLFDFEHIEEIQPSKVFEYLDEIRCQSPVLQKKNVDSTPVHTESKLINFLASTSTPEKHKTNNDHRNIKLFEPLVIQCLKLFTKSDAEMQSHILDMLCQVLQLKVNYCLLDANNIFMEFILKLIDSIETGIIRNSHILTPKVVKFLFYLAKQKEKPQMSIPKIINITDNLLANSITNNGSVEALYHLAFEIYFPRYIEHNSDEPQYTIKELNTQKEVVFSMLLKFVHSFKIRKMICLVLTKEMTNSKEIHAELTECLLHLLSDKMPLIIDSNDYFVMKEMFLKIRLCLIGQRTNLTRLLARLQRSGNSLCDDMAIKTIILDCISEIADEHILLECISADQLIECIQNDLCKSIAHNSFEYMFIFDGELRKIMDYFHIFGNYLQGTLNILLKCNQLGSKIRQKFSTNSTFIESLLSFMRNVSKFGQFSNVSMQADWIVAKSHFAIKLFTLIFELFKPALLLEQMKIAQNDTKPTKMIYDQCIFSNFIEFVASKPIDNIATEFLLMNYFTKVLLISPKFVMNASKKEEFLDLVLNKISKSLKINTSQMEFSHIFLDVIETSEEVATISTVKYLLNTPILYQECAALSRRSFKMLDNKLRKIRICVDDQKDLVPLLEQFQSKFQCHAMFSMVEKSIENILTENQEKSTSLDETALNIPIDEEWFFKKAIDVMTSKINKQRIFQILCEVKAEQKLSKIFELTQDDFDMNLLPILIECAFESMIAKFKHDCFQHNPHMNYLKISAVLRQSTNLLCNKMDEIVSKLDENSENPDTNQSAALNRTTCGTRETMAALCIYLKYISRLQQECMIYVEVLFVNKFLTEQMFRKLDFRRLEQFAMVCLNFIENMQSNEHIGSVDDLMIACDCLIQILRIQSTLNESNHYFNIDDSNGFFNRLLLSLYELVRKHLASESFLERNQLKSILNPQNQCDKIESKAELCYAKAIFLGVFVENNFNGSNNVNRNYTSKNVDHLNSFKEMIVSLIIATMRHDSFYFFAITPREIINSFDWLPNPSTNRITFQSVPIDCLNEIEIVEQFLKRINIFGIPSRQHFEEFFMSLLLLINKDNDANIVDAQEEYQIKNMCILTLLELLISCKMYPIVGDRLNGLFHHVPRLERLKADTISSRKLHGIQNGLMNSLSVFYIPNLEHCNQKTSNIIGTGEFLTHQYDLNVIWHIIEGQPAISRSIDVELKNMKYFLDVSAIDFNSSIQLTFDVLSQLLDINCVQILPHIVKFSELCGNREQFHWIKDTMFKLHEAIPLENAVAHQSIAYCLCRSYAILIPTIADVNQLCGILRNYLKNPHLFVRVATLNGLLLVFESCIKSNTTIGSLSEEILLLRTFISNYIMQHGINEESSLAFSNKHTILVWTLNFYVIESTSKYVPDCEIMTNTIISANNVLKRTTSLDVFSCIIHGLERVIISQTITRFFHEKIEKLALDLVKSDNEKFSLLALKLLVTCMYIGSNEQLENTEKCNGIVQDEPEVILLTTEKIEILFQRIKLATRPAAHIYGNVLCQMTHDLVPPKEVLTKVIKEFLTVSQPHCEVIARVLFEVFRSAIDSAYLPMLQDWLLCSLPNFLSFSTPKIMWYLIVIFISASINLSLIKIFPQVLADYNAVFSNMARNKFDQKSASTSSSLSPFEQNLRESKSDANDCVAKRQQFLFTLACKDFYERLNNEQRRSFRDIFSKLKESEIYEMLKAL